MNQANFLQSLGWAIINSLWQLALLWLVYQIVTSLVGKWGAASRSRLAVLLLITGFGWFIYTFFRAMGNEDSMITYYSFSAAESLAVNNWLSRILPAASVIYLLLLFVPLFRFIRNYRYVQVIRQYGLTRPAAEWRLFVNRITAQMGISKPVQIWISEWVTTPVTIGFLKPVILVPMAVINQLSTQQMEAVLLHELAHIRRHDYLLNLVINIIRTILYFNPFARAFVRIVESEREKNCDELVLQFQYAGYDYASALLSLEKLSHTRQFLVLGAGGNNQELLGRIESILGVQPKKKLSLRQFTTALTAIFYILLLQTMFLLGRTVTMKAVNRHSGIIASTIPGILNTASSRNGEFHLPTGNSQTENVAGITAASTREPFALPEMGAITGNPDLINVSYEPVSEPVDPASVLDLPEKEMVQEAVASSRKLLESTQWSSIEKSLADVFTEKEKAELKAAYRKEMSKFDWKQWEIKLMQAYDQVNWEKVNRQLSESLYNLRTDSLMKVYSDAMVNLNLAKKELANQSSGVAVAEANNAVRAMAEKQQQLQKELNRLKGIRSRKIIQL
ncbi:MAG TPA: M56 family metallopeptidase [Chitinophagaceae bacterium]|nr:M56 family metallopeptidase [Chitinophagaceae bacterium]